MRAELDGLGLSLTNSSRLLARLLGSLELPPAARSDSESGLGSLICAVAPRVKNRIPQSCELLAPLFEAADLWAGNEEAVELLERYLAGDLSQKDARDRLRVLLPDARVRLPALRINYGRVHDRLLAQMEQLRRVAALAAECYSKGMLIVIDELDHDFGAARFDRSRAIKTIEALAGLAGDSRHVVLLLAPPGSLAETEVDGVEVLNLPTLPRAQLQELVEQTVRAYQEFQPALKGDSVDTLFAGLHRLYESEYKRLGWGARFFIRATVEACELAVHRGVAMGAVLRGG